jgi:hypothetical protein
MSRLVDLSPAVPRGFRGPPSTDVGVEFDVRVKPGYWQSAQATLSERAIEERKERRFAGIDAAPARAFAQVAGEDDQAP